MLRREQASFYYLVSPTASSTLLITHALNKQLVILLKLLLKLINVRKAKNNQLRKTGIHNWRLSTCIQICPPSQFSAGSFLLLNVFWNSSSCSHLSHTASHLEPKLAGRTSVSRASYTVCRAKDKMKMGGPLFKKY